MTFTLNQVTISTIILLIYPRVTFTLHQDSVRILTGISTRSICLEASPETQPAQGQAQ